MGTRLSAKMAKLRKSGKLKDLPGGTCIPASLFSMRYFEEEIEENEKRKAELNNPETLEKRRAFKRQIDAEKIADFERHGHKHLYNYDEWVDWTSNNYIKSWYTVKLADGTIIDFARPNAGVLCGYTGREVRPKEKGVMVKLADVFPW